ncbi:zinc ABC transporter substrate-binding protein ZnuA [Plesiomonas sp.]|uniref:zinc ABC transporter substrate-binding protein ZnuA n=1 Tax=Plesiomonas sp. TaxID=2486279 RepID=UPI003F2E51D1
MIKRICLLSLFVLPTFNASAYVLTSVKPLGFIASAIADGVTTTEVLLPNGASPHDYALRPSDIKRIQGSDLVVWVGNEMEPFLVKPLAEKDLSQQIQVKTLSSVIPLLHDDDDNKTAAKEGVTEHSHTDHDHASQTPADHHEDDLHHAHEHHEHEAQKTVAEHATHTGVSTEKTEQTAPITSAVSHDGHNHGSVDLHVWMSPSIALHTAVAIHKHLLELFPEQKDKLDANLQDFKMQIAHLPEKVGSILRPVQNNAYIVFHDGYGYFESFAGLHNVGHFTVNPEVAPGARTLKEIKQKIQQQNVTCVFTEPQFRPSVVNAVTRGTSVNIGTLDPLGEKVSLGKDSYIQFLEQLSRQYASCLGK